MIISITGKSGSGKSSIARMLSKWLGFVHVDIDKIGHSIYRDEEMCKKLVELFGSRILDQQGNVNRKAISKIIFSAPQSQLAKQFNIVTWEYMKQKIDEKIKNNNVVLDWINLPLVEYWKMSDITALINTDKEARFNVLRKRDKLSEEGLALRENASPDYSNCHPNFVYNNRYNFEKTLDFVHFLKRKAVQKMKQNQNNNEIEKTL